jgi:hypothetical protein
LSLTLHIFFSVPFVSLLLYTYYHGIIDHSGITFKRAWWQPWQPDCIFHDNHHQYFHVNFGFNIEYWDKVNPIQPEVCANMRQKGPPVSYFCCNQLIGPIIDNISKRETLFVIAPINVTFFWQKFRGRVWYHFGIFYGGRRAGGGAWVGGHFATAGVPIIPPHYHFALLLFRPTIISPHY